MLNLNIIDYGFIFADSLFDFYYECVNNKKLCVRIIKLNHFNLCFFLNFLLIPLQSELDVVIILFFFRVSINQIVKC